MRDVFVGLLLRLVVILIVIILLSCAGAFLSMLFEIRSRKMALLLSAITLFALGFTIYFLVQKWPDLTRAVKKNWPAVFPQSKTCPFCAERIKIEAIVCKHCGRNLS